jgi:hypothetical protein
MKILKTSFCQNPESLCHNRIFSISKIDLKKRCKVAKMSSLCKNIQQFLHFKRMNDIKPQPEGNLIITFGLLEALSSDTSKKIDVFSAEKYGETCCKVKCFQR